MNLEGVSIIDIGVNLLNKQFDKDREEVVKRAKANGVFMILTGTSYMCSMQMVTKTSVDYNISCTVGIHPHSSKEFNNSTSKQLEELIKQGGNRVVAVGETGLDYNRNYSPPSKQKIAFREHVRLALKLNMPLFIHSREAHQDLITILDQEFEKAGKTVPCVVHCFTEGMSEAQDYLDRGFYLGFTGFICKSGRGRDARNNIIPNVPIDRIMVETDAPFMLPYEGRERCEPIHVKEVVQTIAEIKGMNVKKCKQQILKNTRTFFKI